MTQPYFNVGETVILQSVDDPHLSGEHAIEHCLAIGAHANPYKDGFTVTITESYGYKLFGIDHGDTISGSGYYRQSALRKKHKPSDESFSEIMTNYTTVKE